jgi:hypothetical protein
MKNIGRARDQDLSPDRDHWAEPGSTVSLLLVSGATLLWWCASAIAGPIWLTGRGGSMSSRIESRMWGMDDERD